MLVDAKITEITNPILAIFSDGIRPKKLAQGVYEIESFNGHLEFDGIAEKYPEFPGWRSPYGVCDSVENLMAVRGEDLNDPTRRFIVALTKVERDPSNKGKGGGWRWHKWGEYIGAHEIQCEYLDDEEGIDHVYCFHIYEMEAV